MLAIETSEEVHKQVNSRLNPEVLSEQMLQAITDKDPVAAERWRQAPSSDSEEATSSESEGEDKEHTSHYVPPVPAARARAVTLEAR